MKQGSPMATIALWNQVDAFRVCSFVILVVATWVIAGWMKFHGWLRTGDARKLNHATVLVAGVIWFNSGDVAQDRIACHMAVLILFVLLLVVCRWHKSGLAHYAFYGYARESDRPHDAFHVWFSWLVSILGLEAVDLTFHSLELTRFAALVLGLADAVGEPIGTRFGKHRYLVRDLLTSTHKYRSWEGSLAVAAMASFVVYFCLVPMIPNGLVDDSESRIVRLMIALVAGGFIAVIEAWTPHGLDNLTIPVGAAIFVRGLIGVAG